VSRATEVEWVEPKGIIRRGGKGGSQAIAPQTELSSRDQGKPSLRTLHRPNHSESASQCIEWPVLLLLLLLPSPHFLHPPTLFSTPPHFSPPAHLHFTLVPQLPQLSPSLTPSPTFSPQHPPPTQLPPLHTPPHPPPTLLPHHPLPPFMGPPPPNPTATRRLQRQRQFSTQPPPTFWG